MKSFNWPESPKLNTGDRWKRVASEITLKVSHNPSKLTDSLQSNPPARYQAMCSNRNQRSFFIFAVIGLAGIPCILSPSSRAQDLFPDKNLEAVVRREVFEKRNSKEPLTAKDVENISQIKGVGKEIKNLKGLEACVSLRSVWLDNNMIQDLTPLKDLKLMQQLMLKNNQIKDVTALKDLVKLQHLDLENNQVEKVESLGAMSNMRSLYLGGNKIKDVSVVAKFPKLWSLYLQGNPLSDLKPLGQLKFLDHLDLSKTEVADLTPLAGLKNLKRLMLEDSKVTDLKVLVEMATKDAASDSRFAPFWNLHLKGCPLSKAAKSTQVESLKKLGGRIHL